MVRSALGDYVHLRAKNYNELGTGYYKHTDGAAQGVPTNVDKIDYSAFLTKLRERAANQIKKIDLKTLQEKYNANRRGVIEKLKKLKNLKDPSSYYKIMAKILGDANKSFKKIFERGITDQGITNEVKTIIDAFEINTDTGNLQLTSAELSKASGYKSLPPLSKAKYIYVSTILDRIKNIVKENIRKRVGEFDPENKESDFAKQLNDQLSVIEKEIMEIEDLKKTSTNKMKQELQKINKENNLTLEEGDVTITKTGKVMFAFELANYFYERMKMINACCALATGLGKYRGYFTENVGPLVMSRLDDFAKEAVLDYINENVTGSKTGGGFIRPDIKDIQKQTEAMFGEQSSGIKIGDFGFNFTVNNAQGKVDFILQVDDNTTANVSAKAYQLKNTKYFSRTIGDYVPTKIGLVGGTPLTSILFTSEAFQEKSGTHFLNALVEHSDGNVTNRVAAIQALKLLILYIALSGDLTIKQQLAADILMIEDTSSKDGYTYFFSISKILNDCMEAYAKNAHYFSIGATGGLKGGGPLENLYIENKFVSINKSKGIGAKQRIANVLIKAHQVKIYAGLHIEDYINRSIRSNLNLTD